MGMDEVACIHETLCRQVAMEATPVTPLVAPVRHVLSTGRCPWETASLLFLLAVTSPQAFSTVGLTISKTVFSLVAVPRSHPQSCTRTHDFLTAG